MVEHAGEGKGPPGERRRSPRFSCGGYVEINWLPSKGIYVPGKVRNLSLEGCCIDTKLPGDGFTRAEIVVRTKTNSFRAIGEVRTIHSDFVAGLEFVRLSAGGKGLLKDLMADLGKVQAAIDKLKSGGEVLDPELLLQELKYRKLRAEMLRTRFPFLEQLHSESISEPPQTPCNQSPRVAEEPPLVIPIDLFG
ncbi:MAG: PilZ domain-containing protein [Terriglobales bacterium]|jgi:hypothetical protein